MVEGGSFGWNLSENAVFRGFLGLRFLICDSRFRTYCGVVHCPLVVHWLDFCCEIWKGALVESGSFGWD